MDEQNNTVEHIETNLSKLKDVQKETLERAQKRWISRYKRWLSKAEDWISKHNSVKSCYIADEPECDGFECEDWGKSAAIIGLKPYKAECSPASKNIEIEEVQISRQSESEEVPIKFLQHWMSHIIERVKQECLSTLD